MAKRKKRTERQKYVSFLKNFIREGKSLNKSFQQMADELNVMGVLTPRKKEWTAIALSKWSSYNLLKIPVRVEQKQMIPPGFYKEGVDEIILKFYDKEPNQAVADLLNHAGLLSRTGCSFTPAGVSTIATRHLGMKPKRNRNGHKGLEEQLPLKPVQAAYVPVLHQKPRVVEVLKGPEPVTSQVADKDLQEVQEILVSNLSTEMKRKIIKSLI